MQTLNTPGRLLLDGQTTTQVVEKKNNSAITLFAIIVIAIIIFAFSFDTSKASSAINDQKIKEYSYELEVIAKEEKQRSLEKEIISKQVELLKLKNTK